jgi:hypothetical protein
MLLLAALLAASCASSRTPKASPLVQEDKPFKHELVQNKFGCWEFERNPEYVPNFDYGNAMLGVGGRYIDCMKTAIEQHRQAAVSIADNLAMLPDEAPEKVVLLGRVRDEAEQASEAAKVYNAWRKRNWK